MIFAILIEIGKDEVDKGITSDNFTKLENLISEIKVLDATILDFIAKILNLIKKP